MAIRVGMVSLGCPKNQVDAEMMLERLKHKGYKLVADTGNCDVVVINTCGFIQSAKEEAIENIIEFINLKNEGKIKAIIVTGCLAERYREEILTEMPEVDAVVGLGSNEKICDVIQSALAGKKVQRYGEKEALPLCGGRVISTLPYYAYLKIAEGCDNCCTYCAIPSIRGRFRSKPMEEVLKEAQWLADEGVKELILVAQDTTRYGEDLYGKYSLAKLLRELCKIDGFRWIRILYCYPDKITDELIDVIAEEEKVAKYIDLPLQHCNDDILQKMNRPMDKKATVALIQKLRERIPGLTLRTTLIAGFPTETQEQFVELVEFVKEMKFDRLGCFAYSEEEGTAAAEMSPQVDEKIRERRAEIIMEEQMTIMERANEKMIGRVVTVVLEGADKLADCYFGRSEADAPDIDGKIFFTSGQKHTMGDFIRVRIDEVCDYDLVGEEV
ncbi:30S ribosomal protein S12 methylthiotransferase RimO [Massiliimalia massiliensis]|uniref:30S ribosomal protein S12 methylthiotransferase RimO n=1 Tax=Massiliimalia massiliensis TaxID=1852384 RepID=UPI0009844DF0|nr:30S ribosomal protein S12 methylthiotransferase RimO [Massiliimalia massiliensis]